MPSVTGSLTPVSLPSSNHAFGNSPHSTPGPSVIAKVPISSPLDTSGNSVAFCSSVPATSKASANRYTLEAKRHRRDRPAQFLGQRAKLDIAQPQPAIFLRNRRAAPALLADPRPQRRIVAPRRIVEHAPRHRQWRDIGEEPPRFVLEGLLVVGVIEVHAALRLKLAITHTLLHYLALTRKPKG